MKHIEHGDLVSAPHSVMISGRFPAFPLLEFRLQTSLCADEVTARDVPAVVAVKLRPIAGLSSMVTMASLVRS